MASRRVRGSTTVVARDSLPARLAGIGINVAAVADHDASIEHTLVEASVAGMDGDDLRVLSLLTGWFGVHHVYVNADRLIRLVASEPSPRVRAYWAALASWKGTDRRFARLVTAYDGPALDLLPVGTAFQLQRRGPDPRFDVAVLRVPAGTLRDRAEDVLTPEVLVERHAGYRQRVLMGPSWRADVWTELERQPEARVAEVARQVGCAFATAWSVARDFRLLRGRALPSIG